MSNTDLLSQFQGRPRATLDDIAMCESAVGVNLPASYRAFLLQHNGGEGFTGNGGYVQLWGTDELARLNVDYQIAEYAPGLLLIGSDGGGEAFAFDIGYPSQPVVRVPFARSGPFIDT